MRFQPWERPTKNWTLDDVQQILIKAGEREAALTLQHYKEHIADMQAMLDRLLNR